MKTTYLARHGFEVSNPALPADSIEQSVKSAQAALADADPQIIVGSSRGGAVAIAMRENLPLVLIAPAWRHFKVDPRISGEIRILHSPHDALISIDDSRELLALNGLGEACLRVVGSEHRMNDPAALESLLSAVDELL